MLNCRISQNIQKVCNTHISGIYDKIFLYDIDDIISVAFDGDTRLDSGKAITAINSSVPFYTWDVSDGEYSEENDGDDYTHELTANIHKTQEIETILSDAKNSRFLVAFRLRSEDVYRVIGWDMGAKLTYSLTVGEDGNYYSITFTDEGLYPAFEADRGNFEVKDRKYEPLYVPYFTLSSCETDSSGNNTGFRIANYVTKQNAAGEALDENNRLCEYSSLPQCAYKYNGVGDGGYKILGTYNADAIYNGKSVKQYDTTHCPISKSGTFKVSPTTLTIYAHNKTAQYISVTTEHNWTCTTPKSGLTLGSTSGYGNSQITVKWDGTKTSTYSQTLTFTDKTTKETANVNVNYYYVTLSGDDMGYAANGSINGYIEFNGNLKPTISVKTSVEGLVPTITNDGSKWQITYDATKIPDGGATFTITANNNGDETTKTISIVKEETSPAWTLLSWSCELKDGERTGYKISIYRDMNPKSSTYMQQKQEKELSDDCSKGGETWEVVSTTCQTNDSGNNTGYKIVTEMQTNKAYDTYGQTRTTTVYDTTTCPLASTDPKWEIKSTTCLTDTYGQNGQKEIVEEDVNPNSATYGQTKTTTETDTTICPPNTDAYWETISSECLQSEGGNTGWQKITYEDTNPRSATKGEQKTSTIENTTDCPVSTTPIWVTQTSECMVDSDGDYTGEVKITQMDTNKNSATYGQTRTIYETDITKCPLPSTEPLWVLQSFTCEVDEKGFNTGNCIKVQKDENKKSATYGTERTITEEDTTRCPLTVTPQWEVTSTTCETDAYGQTGNKITTYTDVNPHSPSYKETKTETTYDATACVPNTEPYWVTESSECETTEE